MRHRSVRLPSLVDEILEDPFNSPLAEAASRGVHIIGYTCSFVPEPLLAVEGLIPVRLRVPGSAGTPMADTYLSSVLCHYPRNILEIALEGGLDFIDGWVMTTSCDHIRRLYDNLVHLLKPLMSHIIDLPHRSDDAAVAWLAEEFEILAQRLADSFDVDTSERALLESVSRSNRLLAVLQELGDLRLRSRPPLSGGDLLRLLLVARVAPRETVLPLLTELHDRLRDLPEGVEGRPRLLVIGSQIDDPRFIDLIESVGASVVADRFCWGSLPGLEPFDPRPGSLLKDMARHVLTTTRCPRMMGGLEVRLADTLRIIEKYRVEGVVMQSLKFCDLWGVEAVSLTDELRSRKVPVLRLDREYALGNEGQIKTRVQAFLESMGR